MLDKLARIVSFSETEKRFLKADDLKAIAEIYRVSSARLEAAKLLREYSSRLCENAISTILGDNADQKNRSYFYNGLSFYLTVIISALVAGDMNLIERSIDDKSLEQYVEDRSFIAFYVKAFKYIKDNNFLPEKSAREADVFIDRLIEILKIKV